MNIIRSLGLCVALIMSTLLSSRVDGQKQVPYINSVDSISLGISYADTGAYALASNCYETVSENDTNYALALIEDAIAKESYEQDSAAIILCRKGIEQGGDYTSDFYNSLANAYIDEGNYADAIAFLKDTVLPKYSNLHTLYFTLGLAQYKMHNYADAVNSFEKSIDLDNYDASSHYYLGRCCLEQGRLIPALLSLQFYLLLQPDKNRSHSVISLIEQMTENKYQYNKLSSVYPSVYHDSAFTELDLLIRSKIAMNAQYQASTNINYTFAKQIQLFLEQVKYIPLTGNYWMEKYVPFFIGIQQKKYLEPYLYFILASVSENDQNLQKGIVKNKKKINEFARWADGELTAERSKKEIEIDGKKTTVACEYWDNDMVESVGQINNAGKHIGERTFYYRHGGQVYSKGKYNDNGERNGKWQWLYNSGALKETDNFVNGKREDTTRLWYENGALKTIYIFHDDLFDGNALEYNVSGIITTEVSYKGGVLNGGATYFYANGKLHYQANYTDGKLQGELKEYYVTGQLESVKTAKNNMKDGAYTAYWSNGKVQETGAYKEDKQFGHWKTYYMDGSLHKEGDFSTKGQPENIWMFYYRNGKKKEIELYNKKGYEDGIDSVFDKDGILYEMDTYKDDILQGFTFKDKSDNTIASGKLRDGALSMINYTPEGRKSSEGLYINNKKEGKWMYYNYYGKLESIENFYGDKLNGITINYYPDGSVKDSVDYLDDSKNGYYVSYYINGKMDTQGWYVDGDKQGDWDYYDLKGNLIKHNFFVNGELHGRSDFFESNGLLSEQHSYRYGYLDKIFDFDSAGGISYKYISDKGTGNYLLHYNNGSVSHELNYVNGFLDGPERKYFYNGKLSMAGEYLFGDYQGIVKAYYENGSIKYVYRYDMGNCEDTGRSYYDNGNLKEIGTYYDDNLDGEDKHYDENGKLGSVSYYDEGDLEGEYKAYDGDDMPGGIFWYHNGNIIAYSSTDKGGKPLQRISLDSGTGKVTCYYPNGNKSIQCEYANGVIIGKRFNYNSDGKLNAVENFESGCRNGLQRYYYDADTTLKETDNYYYGELDGICRYYYRNGNVEHEEFYVLGTEQGPRRYYNEKGNLIKMVYYFNGNEVAETNAK